MTRYLGQEQFGWYVTAISFLQFAAILIDFGMIPVTSQLLNDTKYSEKTILHNLLGFRSATAIVFLGITPLIGLLFPYPPLVKHAMFFMSIGFITTAINQIFIGYYQTKLQMHIQVLGELIGRVVLVIGVLGIIFLEESFIPMMWVVTLSSIAYTLTLYLYTRKQEIIHFTYDRAVWKYIIQKSWPIALSIIFNVVYLRGDILLLTLFSTQEEVALYGAAYRVLDVVAQTAMMIMGILMPLLAYSWSRKEIETFKHRFSQSTIAMLLFGIPLTVGGMLLAQPIILLIAGEKFVSATAPLQILSLATFGIYVSALLGHTAVAVDKQRETMKVYITSAIFTLIGYLYCIPKFGMIGAAWMTVFSEVYVAIMLFVILKKYIPHLDIPYKEIVKICFAALVMGIIITLTPFFHVLLAIILGASVYLITLLATGGISKKLVQEIIGKK